MPKNDLDRYARHSRWTEPGRFSAHLDEVPSEPTGLPGIVGGLVLHPLFAKTREAATSDAALRTVVEILHAIFARDSRPLNEAREPGRRAIGTCRNYALLACAILRQHRVPARLRVGFADYFTPGFLEDHWVCEYHDGIRHHFLDAELTPDVCGRLAIGFDPADVPRERFLTAAEAWSALRRGERDAAGFGVSALGLAGAWFVAASLLRDLAALGKEEVMPWDYWGPARKFNRKTGVPEECLAPLDRLAEALVRAPVSYQLVQSILAEHSWAALTPTILSFPAGEPVEVRLDR